MYEPQVAVEKNTIGLIGLVVSVLGIITCGLLSPLGLVISLVALVKPPRALAIAGVVLGAIGTVVFFWFGVAAMLNVFDLSNVREGVEVERRDGAQSFAEQTAVVIRNWHAEQGVLPPVDVGQQLLSGRQDAWARTLRYALLDADRFEIRSSGPDQLFGTDDDIVYRESVVVSPQGGVNLPSSVPRVVEEEDAVD